MSRVYLLPVACFLLFQVTFIVTYIVAVLKGHVVPNVPYISDAATYSPESCFFGLFINLGCILLGVVIYTRYRQVELISERFADVRAACEHLNSRALRIGFGSCLGIMIVANFQETNVRIVHYVGALLCFGLGTVYFWMQAFISYYIQPYCGTMLKSHLRLTLAVLCAIFFVVVAVTGIISHILYQGLNPRKWLPSDGGWGYHVASSICEWIVATAFSFYILTFTEEFRILSFDHPPLTFIEIDDGETGIRTHQRDTEPIIPTEPQTMEIPS
ncbi:DNA damage-regulated autophagy modulator protein 1 [Culicoides brevitarsis]|uniref:DNA damage-regulated autophagy modulator protein 1 n=1 Tax=Culicoides brevitarsis TaxID=469753 RepID=UPI00307BEC9C